MKYWNKSKQVRLKHWTCVELNPMTSFYRGWTNWTAFDKMKRELQLMTNKNKFYMRIGERAIWFESAKDATWFTLKYAGIHL